MLSVTSFFKCILNGKTICCNYLQLRIQQDYVDSCILPGFLLKIQFLMVTFRSKPKSYVLSKCRLIQRAICESNWEKVFHNEISMTKCPFLVILLTTCFQISFLKKQLPLFNNKIENLFRKKNVLYKLYLISDKNTNKLETIQFPQCSLNSNIKNAKNKYHSKLTATLSHPKISTKNV